MPQHALILDEGDMAGTQDANLTDTGDAAALAKVFWASPLESLHDADSVAAALSISRTTLDINRMRSIGIPFIKIGRIVRYKKSDVLAFLDENRHAPQR